MTIDTVVDTNILIYDGSSTTTAWKNQSLAGDATINNTGALTISDNVIDNANLASGTFSNIRGIGEQIAQLNMSTNTTIGATFLRSDATSPSLSGLTIL